jgi:Histidine kinase
LRVAGSAFLDGELAGAPDRAPFGLVWLHGITAGRLGLIALAWLVFAIRQGPYGVIVALSGQLPGTLFQAALNFACSVPMLMLVNRADRRTRDAPDRRRRWALAWAVTAGAAIYAVVLRLYFGMPRNDLADVGPLAVMAFHGSFFLRALLMGALFTAILYYITREAMTAGALHAARLARIELDKQMAEARLRELTAQIEPHFLFNTLAHVKRLYAIDPAQGRAMLQNLGRYLHEALPHMREHTSTLGRELALVDAYLGILKGRMGERLGVTIEVPEDLLGAELPPMMLPTLVENAIKHGISPKPEGGSVTIGAVRVGDHMRVSVADDGVGFRGSDGTGVGLANTRERLATLYGDAGSLSFAANRVRGVTVSVSLPFRRA